MFVHTLVTHLTRASVPLGAQEPHSSRAAHSPSVRGWSEGCRPGTLETLLVSANLHTDIGIRVCVYMPAYVPVLYICRHMCMYIYRNSICVCCECLYVCACVCECQCVSRGLLGDVVGLGGGSWRVRKCGYTKERVRGCIILSTCVWSVEHKSYWWSAWAPGNLRVVCNVCLSILAIRRCLWWVSVCWCGERVLLVLGVIIKVHSWRVRAQRFGYQLFWCLPACQAWSCWCLQECSQQCSKSPFLKSLRSFTSWTMCVQSDALAAWSVPFIASVSSTSFRCDASSKSSPYFSGSLTDSGVLRKCSHAHAYTRSQLFYSYNLPVHSTRTQPTGILGRLILSQSSSRCLETKWQIRFVADAMHLQVYSHTHKVSFEACS